MASRAEYCRTVTRLEGGFTLLPTTFFTEDDVWGLSLLERRVIGILVAFDRDSGVCVGEVRLARLAGMSRPTLRKTVGGLEAKGVIAVRRANNKAKLTKPALEANRYVLDGFYELVCCGAKAKTPDRPVDSGPSLLAVAQAALAEAGIIDR